MAGEEGILRFGFVGAGCVNFGGGEGPWDHASRLEKMERVEVVGIAEMDTQKAEKVLQTRRSNATYGHVYKNCKVFPSIHSMMDAVTLDAVIIGIPPAFRGSMEKDVELAFVKKGVNVFVEKPLSVTPPEEFETYVQALTSSARENDVIVSVGYMFRYHAAVLKMKELVSAHGGPVMAVNARYSSTYPSMGNAFFWDIRHSGGPIIEQATHFMDLARFLAGEVDMSSINAVHIPASDQPGEAGYLPKMQSHCDKGLTTENRVPRVTMAIWKFQNGGVGNLMHTVALHGERYEANFEVVLDGVRMHLYEPYASDCELRVRGMEADPEKERVYKFGDVDPYLEELSRFIGAVRKHNQDEIKSPYTDAAKSYLVTWGIRRSAEVKVKNQ